MEHGHVSNCFKALTVAMRRAEARRVPAAASVGTIATKAAAAAVTERLKLSLHTMRYYSQTH